MTKAEFLKLNKEQITEEIISDTYESSLNAGIDYIDGVDVDGVTRTINIYYYYDGEPCIAKFSSIEDFIFKVRTYGK